MHYRGTIIEESLTDLDILKRLEIVSTRVSPVTEKTGTPWLNKWTLHTVAIPEEQAEVVAQRLAKLLDYSHQSAWYADFKNSQWHYIIFKDKIFKIARQDAAAYRRAKAYGLSLGIPEDQVDFSPDIK